MTNYIATLLDTAGIQSYVFQSNRLRENVGASYLVQQATTDWVDWALERVGIQVQDSRPIEDYPEIRGEKVFAGGGNVLILFRELETAKAFTRILSRHLLLRAPGINLVVAHQPFQWDVAQFDHLAEVTDSLAKELNRKKRQQRFSSPLLGLSVTAACRSTQLVAAGTSGRLGDEPGEGYLVSRDVKAKLKAVRFANQRLADLFSSSVDFEHYCFPLDVDDLGRSKGKSSYVAVVHADGNGMGDRFIQYGQAAQDNRDFIQRMRQLSQSVEDAGENALRTVVQKLIEQIDADTPLKETLDLQTSSDRRVLLPIRPIVYGGDDITFICEGRLGLSLAALYLQALEQQQICDGEPIFACAGISIIKTHYPFARAYALSESLCQNAKRWVRLETHYAQTDTGFSALDWHIANTGLLGSLQEIRQREYTSSHNPQDGNLTLRPLSLRLNPIESCDPLKSWEKLANLVRNLNTHEDWCDRRNKVMVLREVLRQGPKAVKKFLSQYQIRSLPEYNVDDSNVAEGGWCDILEGGETRQVCAYFDAIELMDFYLPVETL